MRLVLATDAQKTTRDAVTYSEWGPPLTREGYAVREQRLRAHPWARAGMQTWLLCDEADSVLASCETFRTRSVLRAGDGTPVPGDSFAIASVFTEERLRGRGYATRMMDLLVTELGRAPNAQAALLFSDVGAPLYQRSGYREVPAWNWTLAPEPGDPATGVDGLLTEKDLERALDRAKAPERPFYLWPTAAQVDWHLERERIYAEQLGRPRPEACGATVGDSTALWAMVGRYGVLVLLWLDARSAQDAAALLGAAQRVAHRAGLSRVEVWEEPATAPWLARVPGATREPRDGSLPMLQALRPGVLLAEDLPVARALWV
ncbi:Acetyltransferase (GNAT) family protein [Stigmatella aurantiaca]|uniref:Acetyltransferase (GNAT) family protein n=1 Tax=Stigmatella aurantiaca TaxID=41 RepID=A0A1H7SJ70_STIAU|nr:N-acetyltransferase [Stigmatella aurantiaca]SEL72449.1 Acetyltransferase (GNAT) family protein [Stigmatella aurantiaca]